MHASIFANLFGIASRAHHPDFGSLRDLLEMAIASYNQSATLVVLLGNVR